MDIFCQVTLTSQCHKAAASSLSMLPPVGIRTPRGSSSRAGTDHEGTAARKQRQGPTARHRACARPREGELAEGRAGGFTATTTHAALSLLPSGAHGGE